MVHARRIAGFGRQVQGHGRHAFQARQFLLAAEHLLHQRMQAAAADHHHLVDPARNGDEGAPLGRGQRQQLPLAGIRLVGIAVGKHHQLAARGQFSRAVRQHDLAALVLRHPFGQAAQGHHHGGLPHRLPHVGLQLRLQLARQFRQVEQAASQALAEKGRLHHDLFHFSRYRKHSSVGR